MYCVFHPSNAARVQCSSCRRPLCSGCDHRIRGYPYCQDCIVSGVQSLSDRGKGASSKRSALIAAFFGILLPGLGAVYNRQNVKAVAHFLAVVGVFQLRHLGILQGLFILAAVGLYFFSIIDAYRTAESIARGENPSIDEERFKRRLASRAPAIGVILLVAGGLLVLQLLQPFGVMISLAKLLPVALIVLGGYLLTSYFKRTRDGYTREQPTQTPYLVVPGTHAEREKANRSSASGHGRQR
jgi:hypothetical protein